MFISEAGTACMEEAVATSLDQQKQELEIKETDRGYSFVIGACATQSICQEDTRDDDGKLVLTICLPTLYLITSVTLSNTYS